ncbi:unnamed protein product [Microthlaspi erraticum]|uniref:Secreted protein n=1 Tax=Microthlaspi erraticum TaxID=1685480 RepID=A0A6D2IF19_9BRAS|nr:unnamed protein product [Microthlaspi erraticum]
MLVAAKLPTLLMFRSGAASTGVQRNTPPRVEPVVINLATLVATPSPILPNLSSHTIESPLSSLDQIGKSPNNCDPIESDYSCSTCICNAGSPASQPK